MPPRKAKGLAGVKPNSAVKKTATSEHSEDIGNMERRIRREHREMAKRRKLDNAQQTRPIDAVNAEQTPNTAGNAQVIDEPRLKKRKTTMQTDESPAAMEKADEAATIDPRNASYDDQNCVDQDIYQGSRACSHDHTFPEGYIHTESCLSYSSTIKYITHSNEEGIEYDHALRPWKAITFTIEGKDGSVECSERLFGSSEPLINVVTHFDMSHERIEVLLPIRDLKTVEGVQDSLELLEYDLNGEPTEVPGQVDDFFHLSSAEKEDVWRLSDYLMKEKRCQCID